MSEEPHIPRRYVTIRGKRATAEVWSSIPGRETEEVWLKGVRPVVKLSGRESEHMYNLIGKVHAALSEVGLRRRAQRFVMGGVLPGQLRGGTALGQRVRRVRVRANHGRLRGAGISPPPSLSPPSLGGVFRANPPPRTSAPGSAPG